MPEFEAVVKALLVIVVISVVGGIALAKTLYRNNLAWTWALVGVPFAWGILVHAPTLGAPMALALLLGAALGLRWHRDDLHQGVDFAEAARDRITLRVALKRLRRRLAHRESWVDETGLEVGVDRLGLPVTVPTGYESGSHTLVVGATGSGKTVSEAWLASRMIEQGHAAIVIDPKGDPLLARSTSNAAVHAGRKFVMWTPEGPTQYNPYGRGGDTEIADKALSAEQFTEPHYQRQAQRYLGHVTRAMRASGKPITPESLVEHMDPRELDATARTLDAASGGQVHRYLDSLTDQQKRDLSGVRDRLAVLAESDIAPWLSPGTRGRALDVLRAIEDREVVYFRLDADRRPLVSQMVSAAILSDLIALVAELQARPIPTVLVIDEFAAVGSAHVSRLFARSRSAGISLVLGAQELADLASIDAALQARVLGNVQTIIAHRQNVPASAELIANIAGTKATWITTHQTEEQLLGHAHSGRGTRRRGYEYRIHPALLKDLPTGTAALITPGFGPPPRIARVHHPDRA